MIRIINYNIVLEKLTGENLVCLYHNSGAFGFSEKIPTQSFGWTGAADGSIRPEAQPLVRLVPSPVEKHLADLAERVWREILPGVVWIMPKSHWAHELDLGNREWMAEAVKMIGIESTSLANRNNGSAIEFGLDGDRAFHTFIENLLQKLAGSDFQMVFPGRATICTIHSHKQLWWTTADVDVAAGLERIVADLHAK